MKHLNILLSITCFLLCFTPTAMAQQVYSLNQINELIEKEQLSNADTQLKWITKELRLSKQLDSLVDYLPAIATVNSRLKSYVFAETYYKQTITMLKSAAVSASSLANAYGYLADFYNENGELGKAFSSYDNAKQTLLSADKYDIKQMAAIERNLGEQSKRMGNMVLANNHLKKSIELFSRLKVPDPYQLYHNYMALGVIAYYESKLDTAEYYFLKGVESVKKVDKSPLNQSYRVAFLLNNLAGVYMLQGKVSQGKEAQIQVIQLLESFLKVKGFPEENKKAKNLLNIALDNLAGIYKEFGNYAKTEQLLQYGYAHKKKTLKPKDPGIFISEILLGQTYYEMSDTKLALEYLSKGKKGIELAGSDYLFWNADASFYLAKTYEDLKDTEKALYYYVEADKFYTEAFAGEYDNIFLDFSYKFGQFRANQGNCKEAIKQGLKTLAYVQEAGNKRSLLPFYQYKNLAKLALSCHDYSASERYAKLALDWINQPILKAETPFDSIKMDGERAFVILIQASSAYYKIENRSIPFLKQLLNQLLVAEKMVDSRRLILTSPADISLLIREYDDLTALIKTINVELFQKSNEKKYLYEALEIHENAIYTRIRSRLNLESNLQFRTVPKEVIAQENRLKTKLQESAIKTGSIGNAEKEYFQSILSWKQFLADLKKKYPKYYHMRYGKNNFDLAALQDRIPKDLTVLRYFYVDKQLYVMVIERNAFHITPLNSLDLANNIDELNTGLNNIKLVGDSSFKLYNMLWAPIEKLISHKRVCVIPDEALHHLSFELLSTKPSNDPSTFTANSLLQRYAISYHYSTLSLFEKPSKEVMKSQFIGFSPGFSLEEKHKYIAHVKQDSAQPDQAYVNLISLPFMDKLLEQMQTKFDGHVYSRNDATVDNFRNFAGNHQIIHIGTHAEANDDFPLYARLIFSKGQDFNLDNSLYLYQIYGYDLTSNLSVLTACETGKSGLWEGEGMISIAHAFKYAGSESILAGFWKIDEQSSSIILEEFYKNLERGLSKDIALQQAKLYYIKKAEGRTISPIYWAGLSIMGDLQPIELANKHSHRWKWILLSIVFAGGVFIILKTRK